MIPRKKIVIVAGMLEPLDFLNFFVPLSESFDIEALVLDSPRSRSISSAPVPTKVFAPVADMPGYMRGISEHLREADLLIGVETWQLSTFQALRYARSEQKEFIVVSNDTVPYRFYSHTNIRAIVHDVLMNSSLFISTSGYSQIALSSQGVPSDRIFNLPFQPCFIPCTFQESKRLKLRNYIGLSEDHVVILFKGDMNNISTHIALLHALLLLRSDVQVNLNNVRVVFLGDGQNSRVLKDMCCTLGVSQNVLFIHQNPTPFWQDLLCAIDGWIEADPVESSHFNCQFVETYQALNCGVLPIIQAGLTSSSVIPSNESIRFANSSPQCLSGAIKDSVQSIIKDKRSTRTTRIANNYARHDFENKFVMIVQSVLDSGLGKRSSGQDHIESELKAARQSFEQGDFNHAHSIVEEIILRTTDAPEIRLKAVEIKGEIHFRRHEYEEAIRCLEQVLNQDIKNVKANRMLGYISFANQSYEEAVSFFRKALSKEPDDSESHLGLGLVYAKLDIYREAFTWLQKAAMNQSIAKRAVMATIPLVEKMQDKNYGKQVLESMAEIVPNYAPLEVALSRINFKDVS